MLTLYAMTTVPAVRSTRASGFLCCRIPQHSLILQHVAFSINQRRRRRQYFGWLFWKTCIALICKHRPDLVILSEQNVLVCKLWRLCNISIEKSWCSISPIIYKCCLVCQVPAAAAQGSRNFHFSIYGKKNNAKVSDDVSYFWFLNVLFCQCSLLLLKCTLHCALL